MRNDQRDATDLADLRRMGRLPEAWIAPRPARELRGLIRHRAKLVTLRTEVKCQVHAVLAGAGVPMTASDLFAAEDPAPPSDARLSRVERWRVASLRRLVDLLDEEIDRFEALARGPLGGHPGYLVVQTIPGVGPVLAAVFIAEIGDMHRSPARTGSPAGPG